MAQMPANLLTQEDLDFIHDEGLPVGLRTDLVNADRQGNLIFTAKGIQAYKYACHYFRCPDPFPGLATIANLRKFQFEFQRVVLRVGLQELRADLDNGRVGPYERAHARALLYGSPADIQKSSEQLVLIATAGNNILPFSVKR